MPVNVPLCRKLLKGPHSHVVAAISDGDGRTNKLSAVITMERLLMLCDAAREGGQTVEPLIALSICTITKKVEPAGRSFFDKYEKRTPSKHRRKQDASKPTCGGGIFPFLPFLNYICS